MSQIKILLADDDIITLSSLGDGLRAAGYKVVTATDGNAAVEVGLDEMPDLAILDIRMPGMSGIEAARELRNRGEINTLFLSAHSDYTIVQQATQKGAIGYLVKPVSCKQLIPAIETALSRSNDIRQLQKNKADLTSAISRNREISVAVGIYMERFAVEENIAFDALRAFARSRQLKLASVARELVVDSGNRDQLISDIHQHSCNSL